jgi:hypothetical protein
MAGRKTGSMVLTAVTGVALVVLGLAIFGSFIVDLKAYRLTVNGGACVLFGLVLLWWAFSEEKDWGVGFETVTMTVGTITAVIAILTLTGG